MKYGRDGHTSASSHHFSILLGRGFSLLEMMMVVAVIMILASFAGGAYMRLHRMCAVVGVRIGRCPGSITITVGIISTI
jgi:prepilin-type N-terminal cleavage/methylation domain-containing protein